MKKFKISLLFAAATVSAQLSAQTTYIDVLTPIALTAYANEIKSEQQNTEKKMTKLQEAQATVAAQMLIANNIQNKVFKGLSEINGALSNGLQIKRIYENMSKSVHVLDDIWELTKEAPEYSIFAVKSAQMLTERTTRVYTEVADILTSGELNLATSGDRRLLLTSIESNTRMIYVILLQMKYSIELAKYKGFWKAVNPFQGYINTDRAIYTDILNKIGKF
jgi:hypothetical protein